MMFFEIKQHRNWYWRSLLVSCRFFRLQVRYRNQLWWNFALPSLIEPAAPKCLQHKKVSKLLEASLFEVLGHLQTEHVSGYDQSCFRYRKAPNKQTGTANGTLSWMYRQCDSKHMWLHTAWMYTQCDSKHMWLHTVWMYRQCDSKHMWLHTAWMYRQCDSKHMWLHTAWMYRQCDSKHMWLHTAWMYRQCDSKHMWLHTVWGTCLCKFCMRKIQERCGTTWTEGGGGGGWMDCFSLDTTSNWELQLCLP
jgi:hypothetical protein